MQTDLGIYPYYLPGWNDSIYNVYAYNYTTFKNGSLSGVEFQRLLQYNDSQQGLQGNLELLITFNADKPVLNYAEKNGTIEFLAGWLSQPNVLSRIPDFSGEDYDERGAYNKPVINYDYLNVSSFDSCKKLYGCIYYDLPGLQSTAPNPFGSADTDWGSVGSDLDSCLRDFYKVIENLYCPMVLTPVGNAVTTLCSGRQDLSANSWYRFQVDRQLQTFLESGVDDNGIWWQGAAPIYSGREYFPNTSTSVSNLLGRQLMGNPSYSCSLETKCSAQSDCRDIGSRTALGLGAQTFPEFWAYAVITSFENLSTQLSNQYVAIKGAAIAATLGTFKVSDFYKIPQPHYGLLDILSGLAFALTLLGGFIPGLFGNPIGAVSATLGAVGGFLGRRATNNTAAMVPQEAYADSVLKAYLGFVDGLDTLGKHLFNGDKIGDNFTILDMIAYGAWVNSSTLQPLYNTETQLATEIVSRSINGLWQTPPYNQSFVLYVDLRDHNQTRCKNDTSGPQDLKYCGGGGVYYTYNFIEDGHGQAHLDYPYGADKLKDKFGIDPAVSLSALTIMIYLKSCSGSPRHQPKRTT